MTSNNIPLPTSIPPKTTQAEKSVQEIVEKLEQDFCLLALKRDKSYRSILSSLKNLKGIEIEALSPSLVFLSY